VHCLLLQVTETRISTSAWVAPDGSRLHYGQLESAEPMWWDPAQPDKGMLDGLPVTSSRTFSKDASECSTAQTMLLTGSGHGADWMIQDRHAVANALHSKAWVLSVDFVSTWWLRSVWPAACLVLGWKTCSMLVYAACCVTWYADVVTRLQQQD
jgi:hypothetical protein